MSPETIKVLFTKDFKYLVTDFGDIKNLKTVKLWKKQ